MPPRIRWGIRKAYSRQLLWTSNILSFGAFHLWFPSTVRKLNQVPHNILYAGVYKVGGEGVVCPGHCPGGWQNGPLPPPSCRTVEGAHTVSVGTACATSTWHLYGLPLVCQPYGLLRMHSPYGLLRMRRPYRHHTCTVRTDVEHASLGGLPCPLASHPGWWRRFLHHCLYVCSRKTSCRVLYFLFTHTTCALIT